MKIFSDATTTPAVCSSNVCSNANGCIEENGEAKCFCDTGYELLTNDTCVGEYR